MASGIVEPIRHAQQNRATSLIFFLHVMKNLIVKRWADAAERFQDALASARSTEVIYISYYINIASMKKISAILDIYFYISLYWVQI